LYGRSIDPFECQPIGTAHVKHGHDSISQLVLGKLEISKLGARRDSVYRCPENPALPSEELVVLVDGRQYVSHRATPGLIGGRQSRDCRIQPTRVLLGRLLQHIGERQKSCMCASIAVSPNGRSARSAK